MAGPPLGVSLRSRLPICVILGYFCANVYCFKEFISITNSVDFKCLRLKYHPYRFSTTVYFDKIDTRNRNVKFVSLFLCGILERVSLEIFPELKHRNGKACRMIRGFIITSLCNIFELLVQRSIVFHLSVFLLTIVEYQNYMSRIFLKWKIEFRAFKDSI